MGAHSPMSTCLHFSEDSDSVTLQNLYGMFAIQAPDVEKSESAGWLWHIPLIPEVETDRPL